MGANIERIAKWLMRGLYAFNPHVLVPVPGTLLPVYPAFQYVVYMLPVSNAQHLKKSQHGILDQILIRRRTSSRLLAQQ